MIVIRNRLLALFYRIVAFAGLVFLLYLYWPTIDNGYTPICLFEIQTGLLYLLCLGFAIIFNAIDLRHGIFAPAAGVYMPVSLAVTCYAMLGGIMGLGYMLPFQGLNSMQAIFYNAALIALPLLEWLLFGEKGTVRIYHGWIWMIYPILYLAFSLFRAVIWPNDPLFGTSMYAFAFYDPKNPLFFLWIVLFFLAFYFFMLLILFLNNVLGRKLKKRHNILLD